MFEDFYRGVARSLGVMSGIFLALWLGGWHDDVTRLLDLSATRLEAAVAEQGGK